MTDRRCEVCDEPLTAERDKSRGRYRDRCLPCIEAEARPSDARHVVTCDEPACIVCQDYAAEYAATPDR